MSVKEHNEIGLWPDVSQDDWSNWKWQLKNRITTVEQLNKILRLSENEKEKISLCLEKFRMAITPYYSSLFDPDDPNCPIRLQSVPTFNELNILPCELNDPLGEEHDSPVEGIVHRYPDRVLFLLTRKCAMYCRHCTRRRMVGEEDFSISRETMDKAIEYIKSNTAIRDVLLSGGDPFILSDSFLENVVSRLREIPHVEVIRIGTRTPAVLPMRITGDLLSMLKKYQPIWINTHFNHPKEITAMAIEACAKIIDAGIPLGNQSVLLRGINDSADILKELLLKLVKNRIRPYYLYQCDVALGISHFRTPVQKGIEIMKNLRGFISGYAVPTYVIDAPGGGGKIPVNPEYLISVDKDCVYMKNYKGKPYSYPNVE